MAYKNFIPTVWETAIERELEKLSVYGKYANKKYEGKVKKVGDTVRILGVGKPTIITKVGETDIKLEGAENVEDTSVSLLIDHVSYFDYKVDDIDKQSGVDGVMDALNKESSLGLADEMDICMANLATDKLAVKADKSTTQVTKDNILNYVDNALVKLYNNNVRRTDNISMIVPPWFYMIMKEAYTALDTNNSKQLEDGQIGKYGNVIVEMSNNIAKDGETDLIHLKTDRAIAFANPLTHTEPYRPEKSFSDAVKGFTLYGAKIVRPKEMVILNCKKGA